MKYLLSSAIGKCAERIYTCRKCQMLWYTLKVEVNSCMSELHVNAMKYLCSLTAKWPETIYMLLKICKLI